MEEKEELARQDLNLDCLYQKQECYHYTTGHCSCGRCDAGGLVWLHRIGDWTKLIGTIPTIEHAEQETSGDPRVQPLSGAKSAA